VLFRSSSHHLIELELVGLFIPAGVWAWNVMMRDPFSFPEKNG
jgi:hypothetical protein